MLALTHVLDLLSNEFASGGRRRFALSPRFLRALNGPGFRHFCIPS
jgi:hypothetical protein